MNKQTFKLTIIPILLSTIIITILTNFKLASYNKYFLFPITILLITYLYLINKEKLAINKKGYYYLIPIILIILGTFFLRTNISNMILNIFILPLLVSFLLLTLTNQNYHLSGRFIKWFFKLFPEKIFSNLKIIKDNTNIKNNHNNKVKNIILGILISIPFALIILSLLTSADMYFNVFIDKLFHNLNNIFNFKFIKHNLIVFTIYFIIIFSIFINLIKNKNLTINETKKKKIETSIINTLLIIINSIFILFIISEISKLTGNFLKLPNEYTYASYAREGFFQLLTVTIINFSIIAFIIYKTDIGKEDKLLKILLLLLITFTIILIFNSYYRMFLYIYEYGFTILRTQVILFLLMELIILSIIIKKITSTIKHKDAYIFSFIIITTYIINIYICNIDVINFINKLIHK